MSSGDFDSRVYGEYRSARGLPAAAPNEAALAATFRVFDARYSPFLPSNLDARIVEIGCGDGTFIAFLVAKGYRRIEGVDSSPEQVRAAHASGRHQVSRADNLSFLKQRVGQADLVVALDVIEHYTKPDLLALLDAVHAALSPTGGFLLQTPNADGPFGTRHRYADFTHELSFTPNSLSQALRIAGFNHVEFAPVEPVVHGLASLFRWTAWKLIRQALRFYLAAETGVLAGHILTQNMIAKAAK